MDQSLVVSLTALVLLVALSRCQFTNSKTAIYLLGDSTSERLYVDGLMPFLNCTTTVDPTISHDYEAVENYYENNRGMLCTNSYNVTKIGYMFHWGVSSKKDYAKSWRKHRSFNDTDDSHLNILLAIKEFQNRTSLESDITVIFIFVSALWDGHRYHFQLYDHYDVDVFLEEYQDDYTRLLLQIKPILRKNDVFVLQSAHKTKPWDPKIPSILLMNNRLYRIAKYFSLPVLDLTGDDERKYLYDKHHQKREYSYKLARHIVEKDYRKIDDCHETLSYLEFIPTLQPNYVPMTAADGTLVKGSSSAVYVFENNHKRHIPNPDIFLKHNYSFDNIMSISDLDLVHIPTGPNIQ